jgi:hypothetical protein
MNRSEIIDLLYKFILESFPRYKWKSASKYLYSSTSFARFDTYNDFLLCQELSLYSKSLSELRFIVTLKDQIVNNNIKIMNTHNMLPHTGYGMLFDLEGEIIITNNR